MRFHVQTDIVLRRHLAEAIAMCSKWGNNAKRFSDEGAVKPMVEYLGSHDLIVQRSAMRALEQLGKNPDSCITMHRSGVVKVTLQARDNNFPNISFNANCEILLFHRLS